ITEVKFFSYKKRSKDQNIERRRILEKNGVCRRCFLCCPNEQKQQHGVKNGGEKAETVYFPAVFSCKYSYCYCRKERAKERNLICVEGGQFDKKPAGAPQINT